MIIFDDVYKRYLVDHVPGKWVLQGVSLVIPHKACVGVVGNKAAGKSTLMRLMAGTESPTEGKIERHGRVVTPTGYYRIFQRLLSGRQNATFICRLNGYADDIMDRLLRIENISGLGNSFNKPISSYTPAMKLSLSFALSMGLDFDIYISDGFNFSGGAAFKNKAAADAALMSLTERAGIIMTTQGQQGMDTLKRYCKAGIWMHEGKAIWFDDINDAIESHRASQPSKPQNKASSKQALPIPEEAQPILAKIKMIQNSLAALSAGLKGAPITAKEKEIPRLSPVAKYVGIDLANNKEIYDRGYQLREGVIPILQTHGANGQKVEYFDLNTQCVRSDPPR